MKNEGNADSRVEVSGSQGIQVGNGNVQYLGPPAKAKLDPSFLSFLSPEVAVTRLQQMSHDEVVDLFARATPDDAAEVVKALATADDAQVVSVLADLNLRKAAALIEPIAAEIPWLQHLLAAAEAIARRAAGLKWIYPGESGRLARVSTIGYFRKYPEGKIYWSEETGAHPVKDVIGRRIHISLDGFPVAAEMPAAPSPSGTAGTSQRFQRNTVYSSSLGTWVVPDKLLECYSGMNGSAGWLGFPTGSLVPLGDYLDEYAGWRYAQSFEGGVIQGYSFGKQSVDFPAGPFPVRSSFAECLDAAYGSGNWHPAEYEAVVDGQMSGRLAQRQHFYVSQDKKPVIYSSEKYGPVRVSAVVDQYYVSLGGLDSWLGLPKSDRVEGKQDFEGGVVYSSGGRPPVAVRKQVVEMISRKGLEDELGWPLTNEQVIGGKRSDRIQFFANGAVVLRNGKREILLRA